MQKSQLTQAGGHILQQTVLGSISDRASISTSLQPRSTKYREEDVRLDRKERYLEKRICFLVSKLYLTSIFVIIKRIVYHKHSVNINY